MIQTPGHPTFHILSALKSDGPHLAHRDKLMLFGQFIGVWSMDIRLFDEAGRVIFHGPGEWAFSWVLDGRVIQDVITYADLSDTSKMSPGERRTGTTLRHYHPALDMWRVVFMGATSGVLVTLTVKPAGDEIWLEGEEEEGVSLRWMFSDITADRFHWRGLISRDGGVSWRMEQEMLGRRQQPIA